MLLPQYRVTEIRSPMNGSGAPSVRIEVGAGHAEAIDADLVVDAAGRGALTLALPDRLGWERPKVTKIGVDIRYATVEIPVPNDAVQDWKLVTTLPNPPTLVWNAVLVPVEGNRWMVTIVGYGRSPRLETWEDFLEGLQKLNTPTLYNALRHAEWPGVIRHHGFPASVWRHFERLPHLPRGVLPIADALCRFNPVYGQGMSSAAQQVRLLLDVMKHAAIDADPLAAVQNAFMAKVASILETPLEPVGERSLCFYWHARGEAGGVRGR
jgi:2-polyprenyl-6-methoxyphenol hydroxylase-like FAD-dependent oxidoreductase